MTAKTPRRRKGRKRRAKKLRMKNKPPLRFVNKMFRFSPSRTPHSLLKSEKWMVPVHLGRNGQPNSTFFPFHAVSAPYNGQPTFRKMVQIYHLFSKLITSISSYREYTYIHEHVRRKFCRQTVFIAALLHLLLASIWQENILFDVLPLGRIFSLAPTLSLSVGGAEAHEGMWERERESNVIFFRSHAAIFLVFWKWHRPVISMRCDVLLGEMAEESRSSSTWK